MSLVDNILKIKQIKDNLKSALQSRGVDMGSTDFEGYSNKISEIHDNAQGNKTVTITPDDFATKIYIYAGANTFSNKYFVDFGNDLSFYQSASPVWDRAHSNKKSLSSMTTYTFYICNDQNGDTMWDGFDNGENRNYAVSLKSFSGCESAELVQGIDGWQLVVTNVNSSELNFEFEEVQTVDAYVFGNNRYNQETGRYEYERNGEVCTAQISPAPAKSTYGSDYSVYVFKKGTSVRFQIAGTAPMNVVSLPVENVEQYEIQQLSPMIYTVTIHNIQNKLRLDLNGAD